MSQKGGLRTFAETRANGEVRRFRQFQLAQSDSSTRPELGYWRNAPITSRALSTPIAGHRIGRSSPASRYSAKRSLQRETGPRRQIASSNRSLSASPPAPCSAMSASVTKPLARMSRWKNGSPVKGPEIHARGSAKRINIVSDVCRETQCQFELLAPTGRSATPVDPPLAARDPLNRPPQRHHPIGDFACEFDILRG